MNSWMLFWPAVLNLKKVQWNFHTVKTFRVPEVDYFFKTQLSLNLAMSIKDFKNLKVSKKNLRSKYKQIEIKASSSDLACTYHFLKIQFRIALNKLCRYKIVESVVKDKMMSLNIKHQFYLDLPCNTTSLQIFSFIKTHAIFFFFFCNFVNVCSISYSQIIPFRWQRYVPLVRQCVTCVKIICSGDKSLGSTFNKRILSEVVTDYISLSKNNLNQLNHRSILYCSTGFASASYFFEFVILKA